MQLNRLGAATFACFIFAPRETEPTAKNYRTVLLVNAIGLEALNIKL
jgi:hypothetical protein